MHLTGGSWQNWDPLLLCKYYLQIHPNSFKLRFDTQLIQNSFQNCNAISSTSQVNQVQSLSTFPISMKKRRLTHPYRRKKASLGIVCTGAKQERELESENMPQRWKMPREVFPGSLITQFIFRLICLGHYPRKLSFWSIKSTSLLMAPPGRWVHFLNPEYGVIVNKTPVLLVIWFSFGSH